MNKKLTTINWPIGSTNKAPTIPVTGQTWLSPDGCKVFDGRKWVDIIGSLPDIIDNIGREKANAILNQVFMDEEVREAYPAVMKAWEQYQFTLQMCYDEDNIERKKSHDNVVNTDKETDNDHTN